mmetsp:Transcript_2241/g.3193  ORF Transcript_2241/g.3193 Transcript_2241/m.3193 type:complete len:105 (+) Transcript_2241:111-425(+)|eukprot:CAMPEP_0171453350 /NCGR_PEP_ID=MMETSP0945-20130129/1094_1 /TAXON_ID=109269 /ORGANISM="Vaucheria litorea, Strain CCMP2940" /LENGTH=104 /DNA_ID=CAMNT_0011978201 /DNA_START=108 /DNA_END=422 /DNA_ORIENTATION=-
MIAAKKLGQKSLTGHVSFSSRTEIIEAFRKLKGRKKEPVVESDEELQSEWKSLENRLNSRVPRKTGPEGRTKTKLSDEDLWLEAGAYSFLDDPNKNENTDNNSG